MAGYLVAATGDPTIAFEMYSVMPPAHVATIETAFAGWLDNQLLIKSRWIDSRLRKRCTVPFGTPAPEVVKDWLARMVTPVAYLRLGVDPLDAQAGDIVQDAANAKAEVLEAANGEIGLFDLPYIEGQGSSFDKPATRSYSEQSPFVWKTRQRTTGCQEDIDGEGTTR